MLEMFNYPNPVENYPDRQIQMLWVSLSLLKCASGWQLAGPILPINPGIRLQILQKLYYTFIPDSCFIKSVHLCPLNQMSQW